VDKWGWLTRAMEGEGRWNSIQANRNEGQENIPIRATRKKADLRGKNSPFQDHQRGLQSHTFSENVLSFFQGMSERLPQSIQRELCSCCPNGAEYLSQPWWFCYGFWSSWPWYNNCVFKVNPCTPAGYAAVTKYYKARSPLTCRRKLKIVFDRMIILILRLTHYIFCSMRSIKNVLSTCETSRGACRQLLWVILSQSLPWGSL
jgi:hypothetical protein